MIFQKLEQEIKDLTLNNTEREWGQSIILSKIYNGPTVIGREKFLIFKPNASIRLEKHLNYTEVWIGDREFEFVLEDDSGELNQKVARPYERIFIPQNKKHKIISRGSGLRIFEIQMGVIEEHDKVQFE